jgi:hypothetical protein
MEPYQHAGLVSSTATFSDLFKICLPDGCRVVCVCESLYAKRGDVIFVGNLFVLRWMEYCRLELLRGRVEVRGIRAPG